MAAIKLWRRASVLGALAFCLATGCGDGGESSSASGGPSGMTRAAFIEKADALCKATSDRLELAGLDPSDAGEAVETSLPAAEALVADLKAIPPPDDAETKAIMAEYDKALEQFRAVVSARRSRDAVTEQRILNQLQAESAAFETRTRSYGFKECGQE